MCLCICLRVCRHVQCVYLCMCACIYIYMYLYVYVCVCGLVYDIHVKCITRINKALQLFQDSWNNHHIRTERGMTPRQLFTDGALRLRNAGRVAV